MTSNQIQPPSSRPEISEELAAQMSLLEHLEEFRKRLIFASVAVLITTLLSFIFAQQLVDLLAYPIGGLENLESIDVTENIGVFMKVSLTSGIILAMPVILYQLIAFIVPGLTPGEKRGLLISLPAAIGLFLCGVAFTYFIMLPQAIPFLTDFLGIPTKPRPQTYFAFVANLILWIGISFEMPLVIGLLARLGVVTPGFLIKNARYAIVLIAILAALITPTIDPVNMGIVMAPLIILYGIGIILSKIMYRPRNTP